MTTERRGRRAAAGRGDLVPFDFDNLRTTSFGTFASYPPAATNLQGGVRWNPDGTTVYISNTYTSVSQYQIKAAEGLPFSLRELQPLQSVGIGADNEDLFFNADGTTVYLLVPSTGKIQSRTVSTAYDLSSTLGTLTDEITGLATTISSMEINPDGDKLYICDPGSNVISEWHLSTPWDFSTAVDQSSDLTVTMGALTVIRFDSTGTYLYIPNTTSKELNQWTCSTPWDVSTAASPSTSIALAYIKAFGMEPSGKYYYFGDSTDDYLYQGMMYPPNDVSSIAAYDAYMGNYAYDVLKIQTSLTGWMDSSGTYLSTMNSAGAVTTASFATPWDFTSTITLVGTGNSVSGTKQHAWKNDGTVLWVVQDGGATSFVRQYPISTPYDPTSKGTLVSLVVSAQDNDMAGICWSSDGGELYLCGGKNDAVYQYTCSTPWDISTASYTRQQNLATSTPKAMWMSTAGDRLCVLYGVAYTTLYAEVYELSTPENVATAVLEGTYYFPRHYHDGVLSGFWSAAGDRWIHLCNYTPLMNTQHPIAGDP